MSVEFPPYINKSIYEKFLEKQVAKYDAKISKCDYYKAQKEVAEKKLNEYRDAKAKKSK